LIAINEFLEPLNLGPILQRFLSISYPFLSVSAEDTICSATFVYFKSVKESILVCDKADTAGKERIVIVIRKMDAFD
jgi:hypothetical protein